ncbi:MAG: hypothetical protein P8P81_07195 [Bacteroidia bacterium]|jgi:hypothetical protein|nr:hypothetical protein [Bacteroidia bacterium]
MKETSSKSLVKSIILLLLFPLSSLGQTYDVETTYDPWTNSSKSTIKKRESPYGRESYKPDYKPFVPDYNSLERALNVRSAQQNAALAQQKRENKVKSDIEKGRLLWNSIHNSANNASRLEHANLIRNYHKSLIQNTSLPKAVNKKELIYYSDVFIIKKDKSLGAPGWNNQGTMVYSGKAYYSYNQYHDVYEIFSLKFKDELNNNTEIFKRSDKYTYTRTEEKIKYANQNVNSNPCPMNNYFNKPMLIQSTGKIIGAYKTEHIAPDCIKMLGKNIGDLSYFEVYFIKDLETLSKQN